MQEACDCCAISLSYKRQIHLDYLTHTVEISDTSLKVFNKVEGPADDAVKELVEPKEPQ